MSLTELSKELKNPYSVYNSKLFVKKTLRKCTWTDNTTLLDFMNDVYTPTTLDKVKCWLVKKRYTVEVSYPFDEKRTRFTITKPK